MNGLMDSENSLLVSIARAWLKQNKKKKLSNLPGIERNVNCHDPKQAVCSLPFHPNPLLPSQPWTPLFVWMLQWQQTMLQWQQHRIFIPFHTFGVTWDHHGLNWYLWSKTSVLLTKGKGSTKKCSLFLCCVMFVFSMGILSLPPLVVGTNWTHSKRFLDVRKNKSGIFRYLCRGC